MQTPPTTALTIEIADKDMHHFREMVRQQLLGDQELLRHAVSGREDPEMRWDVGTRLLFVRDLADQCGLSDDVERRKTPRYEDGASNHISHAVAARARRWVLRHLLA